MVHLHRHLEDIQENYTRKLSQDRFTLAEIQSIFYRLKHISLFSHQPGLSCLFNGQTIEEASSSSNPSPSLKGMVLRIRLRSQLQNMSARCLDCSTLWFMSKSGLLCVVETMVIFSYAFLPQTNLGFLFLLDLYNIIFIHLQFFSFLNPLPISFLSNLLCDCDLNRMLYEPLHF